MSSIESITQIPGIYAAHATNAEAGTGCTVIICPKGATGGVDVRGGAPATRETDLLRPEETVQTLNAVVLSGGSAYGLAASCGVAEELERHGIGLDVGVGVVPIVSGACVFDLACGDPHVRPTAEDGARAARLALALHEALPVAGAVGVAQDGAHAARDAKERQDGNERQQKKDLSEAIDSLINQTIGFEENIELIIIDDESPDRSKDIALEYQEKYPNNINIFSYLIEFYLLLMHHKRVLKLYQILNF